MARAYVRLRLLELEEKQRRKKERVAVRTIRPGLHLPTEEFFEAYKVSPEMVMYVCAQLELDLAPQNRTGYPVYLKVLNSISLLISGHYQRGTGNEAQQCVAQTTVSKYLGQFIDAINRRLTPNWVTFPGNPAKRQAVAANFQAKCGVANILGAIDCTQIKLFPPPGFQNAQYRNRHGDMSINVQLVADADGRILNCNANYPGRCHDQFIFNQSNVKDEMKRLYLNNVGQYFLLGDSGYALEPWLMTPIINPERQSPEERYTNWHCKTRNVIERTNGYLKGTFRSLGLDRRLHYLPEKASKMIYACCTLYNIMKHFRIPLTMENAIPQEEVLPLLINENQNMLRVAQAKRRSLIQNYFA